MSTEHFDDPSGRVNLLRGLHPVEKERHWCFVHADWIDTGAPFFGMAPGPRVVELVPSVPLYLRQGPKVNRRAHFGDWLFWISKRGLFRLTRKTAAWFRAPPPDAELLPAEIVVRIWLPGPHLGGPGDAAMSAAYPVDVSREASDFILYGRDPYASERRRYLPVKPGRGGRP